MTFVLPEGMGKAGNNCWQESYDEPGRGKSDRWKDEGLVRDTPGHGRGAVVVRRLSGMLCF